MRRHLLLITVGVICIALLLSLFKWPTSFLNDSFARRKLLYQSSIRLTNDYEAPVVDCDNPKRLPHEYFVFLHFGYSLEQHKQTIGDGVDLDSAIMNIFPETNGYGLIYIARLLDASLASVRADIGVDMVECNGLVEGFKEIYSSNYHTSFEDV